MTEHQWDLIKLVVDKGLLAMVVGLFSWFLARSLERLKASIAWSGELQKQRMDVSKRLLKKIGDLQQIQSGVLGGRIVARTGADPRELLRIAGEVEELGVELSLVGPGGKALDLLKQVVRISLEALHHEPPDPAIELSPEAMGNLVVSNRNQQWMHEETGRLGTATTAFRDALVAGFAR